MCDSELLNIFDPQVLEQVSSIMAARSVRQRIHLPWSVGHVDGPAADRPGSRVEPTGSSTHILGEAACAWTIIIVCGRLFRALSKRESGKRVARKKEGTEKTVNVVSRLGRRRRATDGDKRQQDAKEKS